MLRICGFIVLVFAIGAISWSIFVSHFLSGLISGNPPSASEISPARSFVPEIYKRLTQAIEETGSITKIEAENIHNDQQPAGHFFWGSVATSEENSCLVSAKSAYWNTTFGLLDQSGIRYPAPQKFYGCSDFLRTIPPHVPLDILEYGAVNIPVRHLCSVVMAEGVHRVWDHKETPSGHLSIATIFQGLSINDILKEAADKQGDVQLGGENADHITLSNSDLFALGKFTAVDTLSCEGYDVFHLSIDAKRWPPEQ